MKMSDLVIKYHDFESAKKKIKEFSEQTITDLNFKKVDDFKGVGEWLGDLFLGGGIGLDHKITGLELNELTAQIQSHLSLMNNTQIKLVKEFGQVYSALEALDKDYIQEILKSIQATEEVSKSIQETQTQIKKIVEYQRDTLLELEIFKHKLDGYAHLGDIDDIWGEGQKAYKEINTLSNLISNANASIKECLKKVDFIKAELTVVDKSINDFENQLRQQNTKLESTISFTSTLEKITHLQEIDEMWERISTTHDSIQNIGDKLTFIENTSSKQQADIDTLLSFMEKMFQLAHLSDVDTIWNQTENHQLRIEELTIRSETHTAELKELNQRDDSIIVLMEANKTSINELNKYKEKLGSLDHLDDIDGIWNSLENHIKQLAEMEKQSGEIMDIIQIYKNDTSSAITSVSEQSNMAMEMLERKIKRGNLLAAGALGLALIELIVILVKMI